MPDSQRPPSPWEEVKLSSASPGEIRHLPSGSVVVRKVWGNAMYGEERRKRKKQDNFYSPLPRSRLGRRGLAYVMEYVRSGLAP